ncbi:MAG: exodeoxyribonuclease III [Verrucomicrobiales bacterium]|jgi:exodeoxyribonuclease-3|nr:exodeoxyribonuclease III [Verrucomicrobiales bacterium]|tara:strand:- start:22712 stop:23476 length:765 start_codon:yes stop_codon:yes gene_type:complete
MKLISWNVNGIRAVLKKNFLDFLDEHQPDVLLLQEVKAERDQVEEDFEAAGWNVFWNPAVKKGYSGVAALSRTPVISSTNGIGIEEHDQEGRVITLEYDAFYVVGVYTPNAQNELRRLDYRVSWNAAFLNYVKGLEKRKPVIFAGDLNVSHTEIDLARPKQNRKNAGFSDEERAGFDDILAAGFVDTFRHFHPDEADHYSWWSYRGGARAKNVGWRLDYFCVTGSLMNGVKSAKILSDVMGSDHCPVEMVIETG